MILIQVIKQDSEFCHEYSFDLEFSLCSTHLVHLLSLKMIIVACSSFFYTALKERHEKQNVSF